MLSDSSLRALAQAAIAAKENAYAPYSRFAVGAALLTEAGQLYTGCNIENASYPAGLCAERVALGGAVAAGERRFVALAVAGSGEEFCTPCGICRQMFAEFCQPNLIVLAISGSGRYRRFTLGELLPEAFDAGQLRQG